jgi:hypothetical protein
MSNNDGGDHSTDDGADCHCQERPGIGCVAVPGGGIPSTRRMARSKGEGERVRDQTCNDRHRLPRSLPGRIGACFKSTVPTPRRFPTHHPGD